MGSGRNHRSLRHDSRESTHKSRNCTKDSKGFSRESWDSRARVARLGRRNSHRESEGSISERRETISCPERPSQVERGKDSDRTRERLRERKHTSSSERVSSKRKRGNDKLQQSEKDRKRSKSREDVASKRQSRFDIVGPVPKSKRLIAPPLVLDNDDEDSILTSLRQQALQEMAQEGDAEALLEKVVEKVKHKQEELNSRCSTHKEAGFYQESVKILEQHTRQLHDSVHPKNAEKYDWCKKQGWQKLIVDKADCNLEWYGKSAIVKPRWSNKPAPKFVSAGRFLPSIGSMEDGAQSKNKSSPANLIEQWTEQMSALGLVTCHVDVASQQQHNSSTYGQGYKLLKKLGYQEGQGLGKDLQGIAQPVSMEFQRDKKGLSYVKETPAATDNDEQNGSLNPSARASEKRRRRRRKMEKRLNLQIGALTNFQDEDLDKGDTHVLQLLNNPSFQTPNNQHSTQYQHANGFGILQAPSTAHSNKFLSNTFQRNNNGFNTCHVAATLSQHENGGQQFVQKNKQFQMQNQSWQGSVFGGNQFKQVFNGGGKNSVGMTLPPPIAINGVPVEERV